MKATARSEHNGSWAGGAAGALGSLLALALLMTGCAGASQAAGDRRPTVLATISILADFAGAVGGEHVVVESIVGVGGDPHTYEPVPSDAGRINDADLIVRNGLGLEPGLDTLIEAAPDAAVLTVAEEQTVAVTGQDPHLWMDPILAAGYVRSIRDALSDLVPEHAAEFSNNAEAYLAELADLSHDIAEFMATVPPERRKLVTTHDAFRYFGERYGLDVVGTIWSISTERDPSADEVAALVDAVREQGVPAVFVETTVNPDLMRQVARDAGVEVGPPLYGDALGEPGSGADTYLGMMRSNAEAIVSALGGQGPP